MQAVPPHPLHPPQLPTIVAQPQVDMTVTANYGGSTAAYSPAATMGYHQGSPDPMTATMPAPRRQRATRPEDASPMRTHHRTRTMPGRKWL